MKSELQILERPSFLIALGLLLTAFISRYYGISEWSLAGDEYFTAVYSHERYTSLTNPAYYSLVVATYKIFGQAEWLSRMPAVVLGSLSIPILYLTWSRVIGRNAALFAALIALFSAWHLWFSQYARFYIGVFFFSSLAYYFFYTALLQDKRSHLIFALLCSVIAITFHATAVFVPASCAASYLLLLVKGKSFPHLSVRIAKIYLTLCLLAAIPATPYFVSTVLGRWLALEQTWGYNPILIIPQVVKYIQLPIVVSAFFGWLLLLKKNTFFSLFLAIGIGLPLLFLLAGSSKVSVKPDYIYYILPLLFILGGVACEYVRSSQKQNLLTSNLLICIIIISLLPEFISHYTAKRSLDFRNTVAFVEKNYHESDQIFSFVHGFNIYAEKEHPLLPFISFERNNKENWEESLKPLLTSDQRTWIIASSKRQPLAPKLEKWLLCNAKLVWRDHAKRLDYEVDGFQVFLVPSSSNPSAEIKRCQ